MEIKYICTYWGQGYLPVSEFVDKAMQAGFDGVDVNIPYGENNTSPILDAIKNSGASFIVQQYLPKAIETFGEYRIKMNSYLHQLASLNPLFINAHTGKDFYSFDENSILIEDCFRLNQQNGIKIVHETHRGRFAFHPGSLIPYIQKFQNLELNADFSHFCVVSESLLEDQEKILALIIPRCSYIHARVGFSQAAQVNHPFAPEWEETLNRFVGWWQQILNGAKSRGESTFYICPEFGPTPYMPVLPFTQQPIANQWDINTKMMEYLKSSLH